LWIFFGLLAVVPWQVIRGQDRPVSNDAESTSKWQDGADNAREKVVKRKSDRSKSNISIAPIVRAQTPPPQSSNGLPSLSPMTPIAPNQGSGEPFASDEANDGFLADERFTGQSGRAFGSQFRISAITGPAIGRTRPIFPIEMMPYVFANNAMFFADIRGFTNTNNGWGGNFGGGARLYMPRLDRILGFNAYYDYDNTSGALFREVGFGVESLGALYDVRANAYLPTGSTSQQLSLTNVDGTQRFAGHLLLVDQQKIIANALHGFDAEIGVPVPGKFWQRHDVRVFGGGYWFEGQNVDSFGGWKIRAQGNVTPNISMNLAISNDRQFDTNVVFGATWAFGGFKQQSGERKTQYDRMTTPVIRQYNMVVGQTTEFNRGVAVVNPTSGNPYIFEHVDSNATGTIFDGTVEHPFTNLADAQAVTNKDIVFVHANSTFSGVTVALQENVRVLGEASTVEHTVDTFNGPLLLPHPTTGTAVRPIFTNAPGAGVILASNSEFSGFQIGNAAVAGSGPTGIGIFGGEVSNVLVRETDVNFAGGESVFLRNTGGVINFLGDKIADAAGNNTTFHISGTTGIINISTDPLTRSSTPTPTVITNAGGIATLVENTVAGSNVNFTGSTINDTAGQGIQILNNFGQITLGDANITNSLVNGVNIFNDSGIISGQGTLTIINPNDDAINIQNLASTGQVSFTPTAAINISNQQARGINLLDNAGSVSILAPVIITSQFNVAQPAIEYSGSSGNAVFGNVTITGGGRGIVVDPSALGVTDTGQFSVRGTTTINNSEGDAITIRDVDSVVSFNTLNITNRERIGIEILDTRGSVSFGGIATIANTTTTSNFPGLDIRGNGPNATVSFNILNITGASGPAPAGFGGVGVNIGGTQAADFNPGRVIFTALNVNSSGGVGLFADNVGVLTTNPPSGGLTISTGAISSNLSTAVDIQNTAMNVSLTSVSSTNSPTTGITLANNSPFTNTLATALANFSLRITGNAGIGRGSGGTISNANGNGIDVRSSGAVSFANMNINNNLNGIVANNTLRVVASNIGFNTNTVNGFSGTNVAEVDISGSLFNNNGGNGVGDAIFLTANQTLPLISPTGGSYLWNITNNSALNGFNGGIITRADSFDGVVITNSGRLQDPVSGLVTPLVLNFSNNAMFVNNTVGGVAGLLVNWTGPESGSINVNQFNLAGNETGIAILNNDLDFLTNFAILGNTVTATGGGNFGLFVDNLGPTDLQIGTFTDAKGNVTASSFNFTQIGGSINNSFDIGMQFTTGTNSNIDIFSNTITMTGNGFPDRGIVFQFLQAPTVVTLSNNFISVNDAPLGAFAGQGIDFIATNGVINLAGGQNNNVVINGVNNQAGTSWVNVSAAAATRGTFTVNNFSVP